ncbi:MAG TPA: hypothetical protein VKJ07_09735, partial [Mycobacteriales bacterium]|nr:hypothetical protein [Mycobacteriales bacterium]
MLVTLDVTPTEALASLSAHVTNSTSGVEGDMTDVSAPTGLTRHLGFAVNKDVDDTYTVTLIPTDLAGNVGAAVTRSFDVNKGPAFSGNHFAVTYTGSAGTTLITSGSSTGSYTFTIPTLGSAATATISDGTRSYSTSSAIKAASGGTLASVPVQAAGVTGSSILFTLTITNAAGGSVTQTAALIVVPPPSVSGFSLSPAAATDGSPVTITATIAGGRAFLSGTGFASTEVQNGSTFVPPAGSSISDYILTVKNSAGDLAGTATSGTQSVASTPAPSFGTGTFAVTWTGSNSSLITAGSTSGQGTYTFTIPQFVAASGVASIKDNNNVSYSTSGNIKTAAGGPLGSVTITAASVASPGTLTFTLAIGNTATTPAQVFQTAALTVV